MVPSIHILFLTNAFPTEEKPSDNPCIMEQFDALKSSNVRVDLLVIERENKINYLKIAWKIFLLNFKRKQYDLIHAFYGHSGLLACMQFRYPIVVTFLGSDLLGGYDKYIGRLVARFAKVIIVMSDEMKKVSGRVDALVIPFGVNRDIFKPYPIEVARKELGFPINKKLILFPWDPTRSEKRFDIVQEAVQKLQKSLDVEIVVVYGKTHDIMVKYMNACDVLVLASDYEGSPLSVREALACSLPVVSVDVGDVREVIEGLNNSYIVEQDSGDLAEKLGWVLNSGIREDDKQRRMDNNELQNIQRIIGIYKKIISSQQNNLVVTRK